MSRNRPLIAIAGIVHPDVTEFLNRESDVVVVEDLTEAGVIAAAREAHGILFRLRPRCSKALMTACPRLRVVGRHGAGLDMVDVAAATRLGVVVVHAPGSNAHAVAEHALMLMLACAKHVITVDRMTRARDWTARWTPWNTDLCGKVLGIVGVGNCGRLVAKFAGAIGMRVLGYDKYLSDEEVRSRGAEPMSSLAALLREADILTCHVPLTDETRGMINADTLAHMKRGAIFINTSRGPVHNEADLLTALSSGRLAGAGLDVFETEPSPAENPIFKLDNVVVSCHVAGLTVEASRRTGMMVAAEMLRVLRGEPPQFPVHVRIPRKVGVHDSLH